ncbi:MAG: HK97-gp10 family putative phage morphogenesis protein [Carboxydocellales bacterium]
MAEITLTGMDDLISKLQALGDRAERIENEALMAGGKVLQKGMSERAPRSDQSRQKGHLSGTQSWRTGQHAADNIKISRVKLIGGVKGVFVGVSKGDSSRYFYLKFHEWGTSKMPATPFIGPTVAEDRGKAIDAMKTVVKAGLGL